MTAPLVRLATGDQAPAFTLTDQNGELVSLSDFTGAKLVIFVYPAAMTPGCTKEACDFRDSTTSLLTAGYRVIGISKDSVDQQQRFAAAHDLPYPLLSDPDHHVLAAYGAWGVKKLYGKEITGVIRSTFVIDEDGTVTLALYNVKATGHVARLRRELGIDPGQS